jgi:hypothetical protein
MASAIGIVYHDLVACWKRECIRAALGYDEQRGEYPTRLVHRWIRMAHLRRLGMKGRDFEWLSKVGELESVLDGAPVPEIPRHPARDGERPGVYILQADNGLCKIGCSRQMKRRVSSLLGSLPTETVLLHSIYTDEYERAERRLHDHFRGKRVRGNGSNWVRTSCNG